MSEQMDESLCSMEQLSSDDLRSIFSRLDSVSSTLAQRVAPDWRELIKDMEQPVGSSQKKAKTITIDMQLLQNKQSKRVVGGLAWMLSRKHPKYRGENPIKPPALTPLRIIHRLMSPEVTKIHLLAPDQSSYQTATQEAPRYVWGSATLFPKSPLFQKEHLKIGLTIVLNGGAIDMDVLLSDIINLDHNGRIFTTVVLINISVENIRLKCPSNNGSAPWKCLIGRLVLGNNGGESIQEQLLSFVQKYNQIDSKPTETSRVTRPRHQPPRRQAPIPRQPHRYHVPVRPNVGKSECRPAENKVEKLN